jgi:hypothetical protein
MSAAGWARRSAPEWGRPALAPPRRWRAQRPTQTAPGAPGRQLLAGPCRGRSWVPLRSSAAPWTGTRTEWWFGPRTADGADSSAVVGVVRAPDGLRRRTAAPSGGSWRQRTPAPGPPVRTRRSRWRAWCEQPKRSRRPVQRRHPGRPQEQRSSALAGPAQPRWAFRRRRVICERSSVARRASTTSSACSRASSAWVLESDGADVAGAGAGLDGAGPSTVESTPSAPIASPVVSPRVVTRRRLRFTLLLRARRCDPAGRLA